MLQNNVQLGRSQIKDMHCTGAGPIVSHGFDITF